MADHSYDQDRWTTSPGFHTGGLGRAYGPARVKFLSLSSQQRRQVFGRWARRYGPASARYAERSYADWKAGSKGMSAATLERVLSIVPEELSLEERVELARLLRRRPWRSRGVVVEIDTPDQVEAVRTAWRAAVTDARPRWTIPERHSLHWLNKKVETAVYQLEEQEESEAGRAAESSLAEARDLPGRSGPRPGSTVVIPTVDSGSLTVRIKPHRHPMLGIAGSAGKIAFWLMAVAIIAAWIFFSRDDEAQVSRASIGLDSASSETPARTAVKSELPRVTPSPTSRSLAAPAATPASATRYTVVAGDSWYLIAQKFGLSVESLYAANGLSGPTRGLHPGDTVQLPTGAPLQSASPAYTLPGCFVAGRDTCNCGDFTSHAQAQWFMTNYDPHDVNGLDGDNDGLACEAGGATSSSTTSSGSSGVRVGAICQDGTSSSATGRGACSHHGGVSYWLYR